MAQAEDVTKSIASSTLNADIEKDAAATRPAPPATGLPPPPNGGFQAWLQVLGAFFFVFNTWYGTASTGKWDLGRLTA